MPTLTYYLRGSLPGGSSGRPSCVGFRLPAAYKITDIAAWVASSSTCKLNVVGQTRLNDTFGYDPILTLRGDIPGLLGAPADGGAISSWASWTATANTASQGTGSSQPSFDDDMGGTGLGGVQFADDDYLELPSIAEFGSSDEFTVFVVTKAWALDSSSDCYVLGSTNSGGTSYKALWGAQGSRRIVRSDGGEEEKDNDNLWASDQIRMLSVDHTNGAYEYLNGVEVFNESNFAGESFTFEYMNGAAHRSSGGIAGSGSPGFVEMVFYGESIDTMGAAERQEIEGWLAHKYSLTSELPADHPYKTTDPRGSGWDTKSQSTDLDVTATSSPGSKWASFSEIVQSADGFTQLVFTDIDSPGSVTIEVTYEFT